jgi:hypothetical protein
MKSQYRKMGKFEIKARRQEYHTALGILAVMREHADSGDINKIKTFIEYWDKTYTEWLEDLDDTQLQLARKDLV